MEIDEAIKNLKKLKSYHNGSYGTAIDLAIKALEATSCIKEKCAYCPHCDNCDVDDETLEIKALEQQPCDDVIRREDAINLVHDLAQPCDDSYDWDISADDMIDGIKDLPSVTPQQKIGKWIDDGWYAEGHSEHAYRCSKCDKNYIGYVGEHKYCPNCGAKMEVEE